MIIPRGSVLKAKTNDSYFVSTDLIAYPPGTKIHQIDPMEPGKPWKLFHNRTYHLRGRKILINYFLRMVTLSGGMLRAGQQHPINDVPRNQFKDDSKKFHEKINKNTLINEAIVAEYMTYLHNFIQGCSSVTIPPVYMPEVIIIKKTDLIVPYTNAKAALDAGPLELASEIKKVDDYIKLMEKNAFNKSNLYRDIGVSDIKGFADEVKVFPKFQSLPDYFYTGVPNQVIPYHSLFENNYDIYLAKKVFTLDGTETGFDDEEKKHSFNIIRGDEFDKCYKHYIQVLTIIGGLMMRYLNNGLNPFNGNTKPIRRILYTQSMVNTFNTFDPMHTAIILRNFLIGRGGLDKMFKRNHIRFINNRVDISEILLPLEMVIYDLAKDTIDKRDADPVKRIRDAESKKNDANYLLKLAFIDAEQKAYPKLFAQDVDAKGEPINKLHLNTKIIEILYTDVFDAKSAGPLGAVVGGGGALGSVSGGGVVLQLLSKSTFLYIILFVTIIVLIAMLVYIIYYSIPYRNGMV